MLPLFKDKGVGVGLRPAHRPQFLNSSPRSVSWVEVISENYMPWEKEGWGRAFQSLSKIRHNYDVALHGVSMNLGSADALDKSYLFKLKQLLDRIEPFIVSDHLSWSGVNGEPLHELLPLPYTAETLSHLVNKIDEVQNYLGRQILIENPSTYLEFNSSTMSETDFLKELLNRSDCGLLLDINNVYVCSVNHNFDPKLYLQEISPERVGQIHLAGHRNKGGYLIDTHDEPVSQSVWDLYEFSLSLIGIRSTMIERDGHIPDWEKMEVELLKVGELQNEFKRSQRNSTPIATSHSLSAQL